MRRFLFLFFLLPLYCVAQSQQVVCEQGSAAATEIATSWQSLQRPTARNPLRTFYRFVYADSAYQIQLKVSIGGLDFSVTQGALFEIEPEHSETINLYNTKLQRSCKGCGSRSENENIPGVTLTFPISKYDIITLCDDYVGHVSLHLPDAIFGDNLTLRRSELFQEELVHFRHLVDHHL